MKKTAFEKSIVVGVIIMGIAICVGFGFIFYGRGQMAIHAVSSEPYGVEVLITADVTDEGVEDVYNDSLLTMRPSEQIEVEPSASKKEHIHVFDLVEVINSTCVNAGSEVFRCNCGKEKTETIDKIEHDYVQVGRKEATLSSKGYVRYECSVCGDLYEMPIPVVTVPPTPKPKSAMDTDMCGASLIERSLRHARMPDIIANVFTMYHQHNDRHSDDSEWILPDGVNYNSIFDVMCTEYRYICVGFPYYGGKTTDGELRLVVHCDTEQEAENEKAYAFARSVLKELKIDSSVTQKEAIERINMWICDNKAYDYGVYEGVAEYNDTLYHSVAGKTGTCSNYAIAFQLLCLSAGIECHYYPSWEMNHAWNKVYFSDGTHRWVDTCWNDVPGGETRYLLVTDEQLLKDHTLG